MNYIVYRIFSYLLILDMVQRQKDGALAENQIHY